RPVRPGAVRPPMRRLALIILGLLLGAIPALAQSSEPAIEIVDFIGSRYGDQGQTVLIIEFRNFPQRPDPSAIEITVDGQPVSDLTIESVSESSVPVGTVLAIDTSGSMSGAPLEAAKQAAVNFVRQSAPADQIAVITFSDTVQTLS